MTRGVTPGSPPPVPPTIKQGCSRIQGWVDVGGVTKAFETTSGFIGQKNGWPARPHYFEKELRIAAAAWNVCGITLPPEVSYYLATHPK